MAVRGASEQVRQAARSLRRRPTRAEEILWAALRDGRLRGLQFRRQHPVGRFVLDFWCPQSKLVVEVDGSVHDNLDQRMHDQARTSALEAHGYRILRASNDDVETNLRAVLERIVAAAESTSAQQNHAGPSASSSDESMPF